MGEACVIPEESELGMLLQAAANLAEATQLIVERAQSPKIFEREVEQFADGAHGDFHPLGEQIDRICEAIIALHKATGSHDATERLAEAAAHWLLEGD